MSTVNNWNPAQQVIDGICPCEQILSSSLDGPVNAFGAEHLLVLHPETHRR
jgi:hypothetical protein